MKLKSKILIFLSAFFSIFLIGSAFSIFVFPTSDKYNEHEDDADGLMDDINTNYQLDANAYTIYFFASPKWANYISKHERKEGQSLTDYLSLTDYRNTLESGTSVVGDDEKLKNFGYFPNDDESEVGTFGYKVRYADTCISSSTFEEVTKPTTTGRDKCQYKLLFIGWTASLESAINYGYNSQGDYNYVSAYDELSLLDDEKNDNYGRDKVIFLFPVFTAGKDYSNRDTPQTIVRIHNRDTKILTDKYGNRLSPSGNTPSSDSDLGIYFSHELYFSHFGSYNTGYFSYKNLNVRKDEQYYMDFDFAAANKQWSGIWYNFWDSKKTREQGIWEGDFPTTSGYKSNLSERKELKPLIDTTGKNKKEDHACAVDETGIYNIYVYVYNEGTSQIDDSSKKITDSSEEFEKIQLSNYPLIWYEDPNDSYTQTSSWCNSGGYFYKVYVKIEKIAKVGLAGGRTKSLEYGASQQLNKSTILPSDTSTGDGSAVVKEGTSSRYYLVNNAFLEGSDIDEEITSYNSETGQSYQYPSDVSAVITSDGKPVPITKADTTLLTKFNEKYKKVYEGTNYDFVRYDPNNIYELIDTDTINQSGTAITTEKLPYYTTSYNSKEVYYVRPKNTGFYSFVARMDLTSKRVTGQWQKPDKGWEDHHYCTVEFTSCEVALAYGKPIFSNIYLYRGKLSATATSLSDNIKKEDNNKFIDTDETGSWYARSINTIKYGETLTMDTKFQVRKGTDYVEKTLSEIYQDLNPKGTCHLTNHLTGREFRFDSNKKSIALRRNYAFYIMAGKWQEGELGKESFYS